MPKKDKKRATKAARQKDRKRATKAARQKDRKRSTGTAGVRPKKKCCLSTPKCRRCPLRMLAEGTLPEGYTVKKRKLVAPDAGNRTKPSKTTGTKAA